MKKTTHRQRCKTEKTVLVPFAPTCLIFLQCCKIRVLIMWATNTRRI